MTDELMLFLALELVSAPGFLMAAFRKSDVRSNEAGLKFFLIGVLSTAVMLYGMSMIYGVTGTTRLAGIATKLATVTGGQQTLVFASILFVVVGFAFKVSAFPFQFWAPDTYEGAPVPVAAFLAVASKAAGFAGLLQLMFVAFIHQNAFWVPLFALISVATMSLGNLVALKQNQIVRLLAYSSIAQAGYMLLPFALVTDNAAANQSAFSAAVAYILIYGIMTLGAFAVTIAVSRTSPSLLITDFAGLARRAPLLAVAMTTFMISLAGVPPTGGFWAKILIFRAAIDRGGALGVWLSVAMLINSVVSIGYYFAVPKQMLFRDAEDESTLRTSWLVTAVVAVTMVAILALFVIPNPIARVTHKVPHDQEVVGEAELVDHVDGELQYRQAIEVGMHNHIRDVAMDEDAARRQVDDFVRRHAAVRASDPEKARLLLSREVREEFRIDLADALGPGAVVGEELVQCSHGGSLHSR
jgi:NADH-quinone oxidoreductase subunit N